MDPVARQDPTLSITSNCGNVTGSYNKVWKNCDISIADEKRAVLEWLSPLEPRERHQAIGMDRMLLNVDRSGLLTICIYSHARWIRNLITATCYTLSLRKTSHNY